MADRIKYWDVIKGIAILTVFFGHAFANNNDYTHPLFLWIYSFHMPLFMIVSGYFFYFSLKKDTGYIIRSKFDHTILPVFLTTFLLFFEKFTPGLGLVEYLRNYWGLAIRNLWFLTAYFLDAMIVLLVCRFLKKEPWRLIALCLIFIVFLLTPDYSQQQGTKFMFPCFVFGYYMNAFKLTELYKKNRWPIAVALVAIYLALLAVFRYDYTFYVSKVYIFNGYYTPGKMLLVNFYRVVTGISGSLTLMCFVYEMIQFSNRPVGERKILAQLGTQTLGMYIFHWYLNYYFLKFCSPERFAGDWIFIVLYTIVMAALCYSLTVACHWAKSKLAKSFHLG